MNWATSALYRTFATLAGFIGIEHGIGEVSAGYRETENLFFLSWPNVRFFEIMGGEPAFSLIRNYLLTGIAAMVFSILFIVTTWLLVAKISQTVIQLGILVMMLLSGAGFGPPLLGIVIVLIGIKRTSGHRVWKKFPDRVNRTLSRLWPISFGICIIAWAMVFPGASIISLAGISDMRLLLIPTGMAFLMLPITMFLGFSKDITATSTK